MTYYAIEIPLQGEINRLAINAVKQVSKELGLNMEIESLKPHICLSAGWCSNEELLSETFEKLSESYSPFEINSYGLGIFVGEKPVIYIRWLQTKRMMGFFKEIYVTFSEIWSRLYPNYHEEMWVPKASLFTDQINYSQLPAVLTKLKEWNFKQSMVVDNITLDRVNKSGVVTLKKIKLQSL